jgi:hypothetical protein
VRRTDRQTVSLQTDRQTDRRPPYRQTDRRTDGLTGEGGVEGEGAQAGELLAAGLLHAVTEGVLPGVELQQLDALQDLRGLFQTVRRVVLGKRKLSSSPSNCPQQLGKMELNKPDG